MEKTKEAMQEKINEELENKASSECRRTDNMEWDHYGKNVLRGGDDVGVGLRFLS